MDSEYLALTMFLGLAVSVFFGFPVGFVLMGLGIVYGLVGWGPGVFDMMISRTYFVMSNEVLIAVPLFVLMGYMLERSGIMEEVFRTIQVALGGVRGSLALTTTVVCTIFAAATGIVGAPVSVMGLLALPTMVKRGYDKALASGTILAGGTLGILIPPSIMLIFYGMTAGVSIARLYAAAIIPGLMLATLYFTYILIRCNLDPKVGPPLPPEERDFPARVIAYRMLVSLVPAALLIFAVLGSILVGLATPTEAAAMGAFGSVLLTAAYRRLNPKTMNEAVQKTLTTSAMILFVAVGASIFVGTFARLGGGNLIKDFLTSFPVDPVVILIIVMATVFFMGFFMEWIEILLIFVPILVPVIKAFGWDPLWFALLLCVNLQTSFLTPPFAVSIFYLKGVAPPEVQLTDIYRGLIPFVGLQLIGLALLIAFPEIILWLPRMIYGK